MIRVSWHGWLCLTFLGGWFAFGSPASLAAAPEAPAASSREARVVELFSGIAGGQLDVKIIAKSAREANVLIKNNTKQPVTVKLPEAFAAVPVLAQFGGVGGPGVGGVGAGLGAGGTQGLGGGFGGLGGGGMGFGGGAFNIAPEKVGKLEVPVVCLEHGKPDPNARIPYEIRPIESFTEDTRVHELLKMLGHGKLNQRVAQAAAWHLANGMSWAELAAKRIRRLRGPDDPYFMPHELHAAQQIAAEATRRAAAQRSDDSAGYDSAE